MEPKGHIMNLDDFLSYVKKHPSYASKSSLFSIIERFSSYKPIKKLCEILMVSKSGYYKWLKRRSKESNVESIVKTIKVTQKANNFCLGYRRMKIELEKASIYISESKTYRLMRKYGLLSRALYKKKNWLIIKAIQHNYKNQIKGDFSAFLPNLKWCVDISRINTEEGPLYLCAVIDLYDRYIVGYKIYNTQNTKLVKATIQEALEKENIPKDIPILLHSDHGSQFSNSQYNKFIKENNIKASMSKKATPTDNAVVESFFATLKVECIYRYLLHTKQEACDIIGEFINYYNFARIQLKSKRTPHELRQAAA